VLAVDDSAGRGASLLRAPSRRLRDGCVSGEILLQSGRGNIQPSQRARLPCVIGARISQSTQVEHQVDACFVQLEQSS
jgi:hypothetical protein